MTKDKLVLLSTDRQVKNLQNAFPHIGEPKWETLDTKYPFEIYGHIAVIRQQYLENSYGGACWQMIKALKEQRPGFQNNLRKLVLEGHLLRTKHTATALQSLYQRQDNHNLILIPLIELPEELIADGAEELPPNVKLIKFGILETASLVLGNGLFTYPTVHSMAGPGDFFYWPGAKKSATPLFTYSQSRLQLDAPYASDPFCYSPVGVKI